jgi:hypothetical protein
MPAWYAGETRAVGGAMAGKVAAGTSPAGPRSDPRVVNDRLCPVNILLDSEFVRERMAPHDSTIGRPSIDPARMVRMPPINYQNGIRSRHVDASVHLIPGRLTTDSRPTRHGPPPTRSGEGHDGGEKPPCVND